MTRKTEQLQIRLTLAEKGEIRRAASSAGMDVSAWVLGKVLGDKRGTFRAQLEKLPELGASSAAYAELSDFLNALSSDDFELATNVSPPAQLSERAANYVAAMVEHAAMRKGARPPRWTMQVAPLSVPYFGTSLKRLRPLLMMTAPIAFRRRNIFIDASVGDRV